MIFSVIHGPRFLSALMITKRLSCWSERKRDNCCGSRFERQERRRKVEVACVKKRCTRLANSGQMRLSVGVHFEGTYSLGL